MNRSLVLSILLAIIATIWVLSGSFASNEDPENIKKLSSEESAKVLPAFKVKVQKRVAEKMQDQIILQGGIEADRQIEIRAETEGTIETIYATKGDKLKAGQAILSLAINDREARLEKAKAELRVKQTELASSKSLKDKNMVSENRYQQNIADVVSAQAEVKKIQVQIKQTNITAAFNGILNEVYVDLGDYVSEGSAIATLVDQDWVTITTEVPQQHIAKIERGQTVEASLLNGVQLSGKINYISSSANPATRTFLIEAKAENIAGVKYFGQSARVKIYLGERSAYLMSPSLLNLGSDGSLQIKTLDAEQRVVSNDVTMIRSDNEGIWLGGLPDSIELITVGQGFVSEGEVVDPIYDNGQDGASSSDSTSQGESEG
ncbi:MAG: multidrug efflux system membrane fusion protein [Oleiphilaceae bacterium]|jgi:multidrug efflux system membrane fusion protein